MHGVHVVSTPNSNLQGSEFFVGLARPSLSFFDNDHGREIRNHGYFMHREIIPIISVWNLSDRGGVRGLREAFDLFKGRG